MAPDHTTDLILTMLRDTKAAEPPEPNPETMDQWQMQEAAHRHALWYEHYVAIELMLAWRLVGLIKDDRISVVGDQSPPDTARGPSWVQSLAEDILGPALHWPLA